VASTPNPTADLESSISEQFIAEATGEGGGEPAASTPPAEEPAAPPEEPGEPEPEGLEAQPPEEPPAEPEEVSEPEGSPPEGSEETPVNTYEFSNLSPAAKTFLRHRTGRDEGPYTAEEINAAFEAAADYNNRLAEIHRTQKDDEPAEPSQKAETPATWSEEQIAAKVAEVTDQDAECARMVEVFSTNRGQLQELQAKIIPKLDASLKRSEVQLEVLHDEMKSAEGNIAWQQDVREKIDHLKSSRLEWLTEKQSAVFEAWQLKQTQEALGTAWRDRRSRINDHVRSELSKLAESEHAKATEDEAINAEAERTRAVFLPAVEKAVAKYKIPKDSIEDFKQAAREAGMARIAGGEAVDDIAAFVDERGKAFSAMLDRHHRARSAQYGEQVRKRAGETPGTKPARSAAPAQPSRPGTHKDLSSLDAIEERVLAELGQELGY
jgi:hypothetical protein